MKGFRRYARIRETLVHELTHNVWGDHDINFKRQGLAPIHDVSSSLAVALH